MKTIAKLTVMALAGLALALPIGTAQAQTTLEKIQSAGEINVGLEFGRPPWGYKDEKLESTGFDMEAAKLIADGLGVKLNIVELTLPNRIPFLTSGKVDTVISTFSITPQRLEVIDFSKPYGSAIVGVAAAKSSEMTSVKDLAGVRVGVTRGSTSDTALTEQAPDADIVRFDDESTTMAAFSSGQVDAAVTEPATLKAVADKNPSLNAELKFTLVEFPIGAGLRKEDDDLEAAINEQIKKNLENGKLNELYQQFFGVDLSPAIIEASK